jgi:hypothetical protein
MQPLCCVDSSLYRRRCSAAETWVVACCPRWERYNELASTMLALRCPERWSANLPARCWL